MKRSSEDLSSKQLSQEMGVAHATIRNWVRRGKIKGYTIENRRFFTREEIEQFKETRAAKQAAKTP